MIIENCCNFRQSKDFHGFVAVASSILIIENCCNFRQSKDFHGFVAVASAIDMQSRYANAIIPNCWNFR
ncbi:hypothetical protein [Moorena bouillonii]|uniref:hypothetical protein n=1 Tax=Moorena bouillonii TaxID=207920 RepID=UPI00117FD66E|nr:hypothetical protein [Moorena bouillonii]NEO47483.1 hypothetical protein [Moorena sp. SIO4A3]